MNRACKSFIISFVLITVLAIQIMCLSETPKNSVDSNESIFKYVSLGDSIARGYGLENPEKQRFSSVLAEKISKTPLNKDMGKITEINYGKDGMKSAELIEFIKSDGASDVKDANLITISIGANDVLSPSVEFLYDYYMYLFSSSSGLSEKDIENSFSKLKEETSTATSAFPENIDSIIGEIRKINKDANIVFLTIYNPYAKSDIGMDLGEEQTTLSSLSDSFIKPLNDIIWSKSKELEFDVADIYSAFEKSEQKCVNEPSSFDDISNFDPHPTKEGHEVIAEEIFRLFHEK